MVQFMATPVGLRRAHARKQQFVCGCDVRPYRSAALCKHYVEAFRCNPRHTVGKITRHTAVLNALAPSTDQTGAPSGMPPARTVDVSIQKIRIDGSTQLLQCFCRDHLRYEAEYGLKRGTTTNAYLVSDGDDAVIIDVPRKEYLGVFCQSLKEEAIRLKGIIITHLNPDIVETLAEVLSIVASADERLILYMSNPSKKVLQAKLGENTDKVLQHVEMQVPGMDVDIRVGRRALRCIPATTPRYPEMLCVYERTTRRLFSSCLFSAHVAPQDGANGFDVGGWGEYAMDWQFFFDCMFAPVVKQAASALEKLGVTPAAGSPGAASLLKAMGRILVGGLPGFPPQRPTAMILPRHGPIVRQGVNQLLVTYGKWLEAQAHNLQRCKIAVLYASAYGNTASLAQAISRGITKAGAGVEMVNLEQASLAEAEAALKGAQGFCIGSPTLGGHMPTQVSAMLGSILRSAEAKALPCGVYGSYGWSGEAVDILNSRLADAGFSMAFKPLKVQFRPDAKALQVCEESGTDLAQEVMKKNRKSQKQSSKRTSAAVMSQVEGAAQAMGRVVGSLSVVTCKDGEAESAMLASWISQASFDPPGLTVAVKKDRAAESLLVNGNRFNVNILKDGAEGPVVKALLKPFGPGEDRFETIGHFRSKDSGCVVVEDAVSVLECEVTARMDAADHYIVYGTVQAGNVLDDKAVSAVHHRKSGKTY